eukprot:1812610-Pyramimonas_sp.AAC.1
MGSKWPHNPLTTNDLQMLLPSPPHPHPPSHALTPPSLDHPPDPSPPPPPPPDPSSTSSPFFPVLSIWFMEASTRLLRQIA